MWGIAVGIVVLLVVVGLLSDTVQKHDKAKKKYFQYTDMPLNGTCDVAGEPESFKITFLTNDNHKISFDVTNGQISTYSFMSQSGKKVDGRYEVG